LLAEGKLMKQVAGILNINMRTVGFHKNRIMEKTGASTRAELVRYAVSKNIVNA
jgi:LuxR family quorum-sensing system transcriptional regulator SolR